jgi:hypothetical protein
LSIGDNSEFNHDSFPPVFKPFDTGSSGSFEKVYNIELTMANGSCKQTGRQLLNYRDIVNIYENDMQLTVELAEDTSDEHQVMANMGVSIALSHILCREDIFLLHAASIVRSNQGYIFPGRSGSGKTTLSRLSIDKNYVLCDELSAVMGSSDCRENGTGSAYSVFPGPRWAQFTFDPDYYCDAVWRGEPDKAFPLRAIIFPSRSDLRDHTWLEKIESIDAAVSLLVRFTDTAFVKMLPAETHRKAFHFFSQLARSIPCYTLHANIQTDFWKTIDETVGR